MERSGGDDLDGQDKRSTSSKPSGDAYTAHPERDLQTGDPNLTGGAPPAAKKSMAEKVKGMFKGHHHDEDEETDSAVGSGVGHTPEASPYGTTDGGTGAGSADVVDPTAPGREESSDVQPQGGTQGVTGVTGGEALTDHQGNLKPGPHTDSVKRETVLTKIKDKLHGSK